MMYIGYWCEEHFNSLILGSPDISHNKMVSLMEMLCVIPILDIVVPPPAPLPRQWRYSGSCLWTNVLWKKWQSLTIHVIFNYIWIVFISILVLCILEDSLNSCLFCFFGSSWSPVTTSCWNTSLGSHWKINEPDSLNGIILPHKVSLYYLSFWMSL